MNRPRLYITLLLWGLWLPLLAQVPLSNKRCKWIPVSAQVQELDTLTLLPSSISLYHPKKELFAYAYDCNRNEFRLTAFPAPDSVVVDTLGTKMPLADSVLVCFRVMPLNLSKPAFKRDVAKVEMSTFRQGFYQEELTTKEEIFRTPGLQKSGSISRGISFGNTQNVFVNSALNLQLDGKLTDEISITAAITDQNIPFQPEGNTQQLQEFDRVYITLKHRLWQLTAGDVVLRSRPSYFMQYYKNVQGGAFETFFGKRPERQGQTAVAASLSKGKFASQAIEAQEGVLGPYRLRGPNNERFIIVLANSERVFLDGRLLVRGYDYDYVIDYNQAEISFTTQHVITKNSRIKVDFEYSDQNYSRAIYNLSHYQTVGKLQLYGNYYNESDNPDNLLLLDLSDAQKRLLAGIGDQLDQALIPGADSVAFDPSQVLYARRDTSYAEGQSPATMYVYATDPAVAHYNVRFTEVGPGRGDYVVVRNAVNGRVYRWVAPVAGVPQGSYAPVRVIPTPHKKQLITIGGKFDLQKGISVFVEGASSENDLNRFSALDSGDDLGKALRVGYSVEGQPLSFLGKYTLNSAFNYEHTDAHFAPIDRYRPIEFDRDWSMTGTEEQAADHILNFSLGAAKDADNLFNYRISRRSRRQQVDGVQHYVDLFRRLGRLTLRNSFFMLDSKQGLQQSNWYRADMGLRYKAGKISPGYVYRFDKNRVRATGTDSVTASAVYFEEHQVYVESSDTARTRFRLDYSHRSDRRPTGVGTMGLPELGQTYNAALQTLIGEHQELAVQATYRKLKTAATHAEETVQGRLDWRAAFLDGVLKSEMSYMIGTGRELKRIFIFRETLPGQGTHYLRQGGDPGNLNDYLEAQTLDQQRYIKVFLPTDEYINAYTNHFTYRLSTNAPRTWSGLGGLKGLMAKFSMLSFVSIDKKTTEDKLSSRFNPFSEDFADEFLISLAKSLRHTVYYNRSNPRYGLEYTLQTNEQKALLANGTETRRVGSHTFISRLNLNEVLSSQLTVGQAIRGNRSDFLDSKNFTIVSHEFRPELAYQPNSKLRFTSTYQLALRENVLAPSDDRQQGRFHEAGLEAKLSQVSKRSLTGTFRFIRIAYNSTPDSYIGYEILSALRPGNNLTWSVNMQQRLSNGLNISLHYDGRKADSLKAVHTGRTQVAVLF